MSPERTQERSTRGTRDYSRRVRPGVPTQHATATPGEAGATAPLLLDRLIHERMRLAIVSALAVHGALGFGALREMLQMTDGNLSVHARRLEEAGYIDCTKLFEGRTPRTEFRITAAGRTALDGYLDHMESLIRAVRDS